MKTTLTLKIECGPTTCASEPGAFCSFVGSREFGTQPLCTLFPDAEYPYSRLRDIDGWLQRCRACMEAERKTMTDGISIGAKVRVRIPLASEWIPRYLFDVGPQGGLIPRILTIRKVHQHKDTYYIEFDPLSGCSFPAEWFEPEETK